MRIAHLSDFHYFSAPNLAGVITKRALGLANLYIKGRIHHFSAEVAGHAIRAVLDDAPDLLVITGDLTALASRREFDAAKTALAPLLERFPTVMVPGNHDYYTRGAARTDRISDYFGEFIYGPEALGGNAQYPTLRLFDGVAVIGLNPNRFDLGSRGLLDESQLIALEHLLDRPEVQSRFRILLNHYPIMGLDGHPTRRFWRKLAGRERLIGILEQRPVQLVLHGHDHLRYCNSLTAKNGEIVWICNAGSCAFARGLDYQIPASYNLYNVEHARLEQVSHRNYGADGFFTAWVGPPEMSPPVEKASPSQASY